MKILIKLRPFAVLHILTLSARCLEKYLSWGLEVIYADRG